MELHRVFANIEQVYNMYGKQYGLMNPRFIKNDNNQITWMNHISNEKFDTYEEYFWWAYEKLQYSFALRDDSLIQLFFEAENKGKKFPIIKGSMAYLPSPNVYSDYFRFDIDLKNEASFSHTSYHAHFGYRSKEARFSLFRYPLPSEFIKFIMFLNYDLSIKSFSDNNFWETLDDRKIEYNHILDFCN